jgi:uncharacterized protein
MNKVAIIEATEQYIQSIVKDLDSSHDWFHINRVRKMALRLAKEEGADPFIAELGALLHDVADWKFHDGDLLKNGQVARAWLEKQDLDHTTVDHVAKIVANVSYKGAGIATPMKSIEGMVVQDADRLDAIGAIAIARAFSYGGGHNRPIYDPAIKPVLHDSFAEYSKNTGMSTSLNHFYEKLLLLKDRLQTKTAKEIAEHRHRFMEQYLEEFFNEWEGKV